MTSVDMSLEAVSRRLIRLSQLRTLGVGLAGPRRRPFSRFGPWTPLNEAGEPLETEAVMNETPPPYRADPTKS